MAERTCEMCPSPVTGRAKTCSAECARLRRNKRQLEYFARYKAEHGVGYLMRYREKRNIAAREYKAAGRHLVEKRCEQCKRLVRMRADARLCSSRCRAESQRNLARLPVLHPAPYPLTWLPAKHPALTWTTRKRRVFVAGSCVRCGTGFVVPVGGSLAAYCSEGCSKRDQKNARRARKRDAFVAPVRRVQIFERDGWRCQLCKKKVRRTAAVPHPLAPVLDHVTPLADGGTHEPANVQCAHYLCNSVKSAGAANDQLRLIG